jgi:TonB family protein
MLTFKMGIKDGAWFVRKNGRFERKEVYRDGKMVEGHCYDIDGKELPYHKEALQYAEQMPRAGYDYAKYIEKNFNYPESSKISRSDRVIVKILVEDDGSIDHVQVLKGIDSAVDAEVVRVVSSMPPWKPGKTGDETVPVWFTIPVSIK